MWSNLTGQPSISPGADSSITPRITSVSVTQEEGVLAPLLCISESTAHTQRTLGKPRASPAPHGNAPTALYPRPCTHGPAPTALHPMALHPRPCTPQPCSHPALVVMATSGKDTSVFRAPASCSQAVLGAMGPGTHSPASTALHPRPCTHSPAPTALHPMALHPRPCTPQPCSHPALVVMATSGKDTSVFRAPASCSRAVLGAMGPESSAQSSVLVLGEDESHRNRPKLPNPASESSCPRLPADLQVEGFVDIVGSMMAAIVH
ncbi:PREDICTED: putative proline-rich protein 21 [Myotis brandtii]|uniref:putative proline-rich protein 21 n=1 Tax=Myotis brandtii TaxID=109478 RepID=UPI0007042080|nr:PREDICTED: putative proline-rich protein 21 [Myotis brandtii]